MAEDYGAPEPGNSPGAGPSVAEKRFAKKRAGLRVRSSTADNERRPGSDDRRRCLKDSRFSQFLRGKSLIEGCAHCSEDRGHSERNKEARVPQWAQRSVHRNV